MQRPRSARGSSVTSWRGSTSGPPTCSSAGKYLRDCSASRSPENTQFQIQINVKVSER